MCDLRVHNDKTIVKSHLLKLLFYKSIAGKYRTGIFIITTFLTGSKNIWHNIKHISVLFSIYSTDTWEKTFAKWKRNYSPGSTNPARQVNMPGGNLFCLPKRQWLPSGWMTCIITTGSVRDKKVIHFIIWGT